MVNKKIKEKLDEPSQMINMRDFLRRKFKIMIIYPGGSYTEHNCGMEDYAVVVDKKIYQVEEKCIIKGRQPMLVYFYNCPKPLRFKYDNSNLPHMGRDAYDIPLDAAMLKAMWDSKVIRNMYESNNIKVGQVLLYVGIAAVILLVVLHLTGVVDLKVLLDDLLGIFTRGTG